MRGGLGVDVDRRVRLEILRAHALAPATARCQYVSDIVDGRWRPVGDPATRGVDGTEGEMEETVGGKFAATRR
jgi:hypothetical protein